ncbi:MAG TPA: OmpW family outer membrane protein [Thiobacillus sp.]|nr:OmpW family outer membrane protein [Thiobacillus sp.]
MNKSFPCATLTGVLLAAFATLAHAGNRLDVSLGLVNIRPDIESPVVGADATNETKPILNLTYYLNESLALNTSAGITRHTFSAGGATLGKASMAPFHLMLQYHFMPKSDFSPYVGAGIHHTVFFDKSGPVFDGLRGFPADTGAVLQAGFDYAVNKDYFINFDVQKFYLETDVRPGGGGAKIETIKLDPLMIGLAVGRHF